MEKTHLKHKHGTPKILNYSVLIISDSRYSELKEGKESTDKTIPLIKKILEQKKQNFISSQIVPDENVNIKEVLLQLIKGKNDIIITSGGTGISKRDITIETIKPLFEKTLEGFGELFRYLSYKEIGSSAMLSRASAGIINNKIIFCLPGSPNAVKLALENLIIPESGHIMKMIEK
ncbi:MAG: molybdenum cofactor biosynthesis protein B [Candidatus Hodarchaeota archaeon]